MPGVDVFSGTDDGGVSNALRAMTVKIGEGASFDFVLVHARMCVSDGFAVPFGADLSVASQHRNFLRRFYVAHSVDRRRYVFHLGHGIAFAQSRNLSHFRWQIATIRMRIAKA